MPAGRVLLAALAVIGNAALAYAGMAKQADSPLTIALLFGPFVAALGVAALRSGHRPTLLAAIALAIGLTMLCLSGPRLDMQRLYVLQHTAVHAALALGFGCTLRAGSTPLITRLAASVHTDFTPAMRAYTRGLTAAWAIYFVAMIAISLLVYALLPWSAWALFCNVLTPLAAVLFFVGEHLQRYRRHPEFERASVSAALRAYRAATALRDR